MKKKKNINRLTKDFWELSRQRQESFLKELYDLSSQNKSLFQIRLGKDDKLVMENLLNEVEKQTINRIGKFRKIRLSKINELLRDADKYALSIFQQTKLRRAVWTGMLEFIISKSHLPERYQDACARHLDKYLQMVKLHVLEKSEKEEIYAREKEFLMKIISSKHQLPRIEDIYLKYFS